MIIGITSIGYNCKEHIDKVLFSWNEIKKGAIKDTVFISAVHACFKETFASGYPIYSTDGTIEAFKSYKKQAVIDNYIQFVTPQLEFNVWNSNLEFLFSKNIDILMMLNFDEVWTIEEIKKLIEIIKEKEEYDYFNINFKNYVFDYNTYVDDFIVPRIWRTNRNGGIKGFYYDDELHFNNSLSYKQVPSYSIPKSDLFPKHYRWVGSKELLQRKLAFQKKHYGICSYKWNEEKDSLVFNDEYYTKMNKQKPKLYTE